MLSLDVCNSTYYRRLWYLYTNRLTWSTRSSVTSPHPPRSKVFRISEGSTFQTLAMVSMDMPCWPWKHRWCFQSKIVVDIFQVDHYDILYWCLEIWCDMITVLNIIRYGYDIVLSKSLEKRIVLMLDFLADELQEFIIGLKAFTTTKPIRTQVVLLFWWLCLSAIVFTRSCLEPYVMNMSTKTFRIRRAISKLPEVKSTPKYAENGRRSGRTVELLNYKCRLVGSPLVCWYFMIFPAFLVALDHPM